MNEQEKRTLNEKLARWVGDIKHDWTDEVCGYKTTECFCENCHRAEDYTPFPCVPDFTDSLDACFKWLVSKLGNVLIEMDKTGTAHPGHFEVWVEQFVGNEFNSRHSGGARAENPALALCLAIEQLIDSCGVPTEE